MRKHDSKERSKRIISRQVEEIESLKRKISELEADCDEKDKIIGSIDSFRESLTNLVDDLNRKADEYDELIGELKEMRKIMNQEVFNGRWNLIRLLMR